MKIHYHTSVEVLVINALSTMVVFHAARLLAAKLASSRNTASQRVGSALGGAFSFGGLQG